MRPWKRGDAEGVAIVLIVLSLLAFMFLPFGSYLWLGLGAVGLGMGWASRIWGLRRKVVTTVVALALAALLVALSFPPY